MLIYLLEYLLIITAGKWEEEAKTKEVSGLKISSYQVVVRSSFSAFPLASDCFNSTKNRIFNLIQNDKIKISNFSFQITMIDYTNSNL